MEGLLIVLIGLLLGAVVNNRALLMSKSGSSG